MNAHSTAQINKQQVLLVFPKPDDVCYVLQDACSRLEMDTFRSHTLAEAIESFQNNINGGHNLIIVDGRRPQILDPETVARYVTDKFNGVDGELLLRLKISVKNKYFFSHQISNQNFRQISNQKKITLANMSKTQKDYRLYVGTPKMSKNRPGSIYLFSAHSFF